MQHSFDISIAEKYGINVAIFLNNMAFWIKKNEANEKNFHDGRYWTYNTSKALSIIFPYWSVDQMDRLIKKCTFFNLLLTGNFNDTSYERKRWYSLTDEALKLLNMYSPTKPRYRGMETAESRLPNRDIAECYIDTDINTDIKQDKIKERGKKRHPSRTAIPLLFIPTESHEVLATELQLDVENEKDSFIDYYKACGRKMIDWNASFRNWLRKAKEFSRPIKGKRANNNFDEVMGGIDKQSGRTFDESGSRVYAI